MGREDALIKKQFDNIRSGGFSEGLKHADAYPSGEAVVFPGADDPIWRSVSTATPMTPQNVEKAIHTASDIPQVSQLEMDELGIEISMDQVEDICRLIEGGTPRQAAARLVGILPAQLTSMLKMGKQPPSKHPVVEERRKRMADALRRISAAEAALEAKLSGKAVELAMGSVAQDPETGTEIEVRKPDKDMLKFLLERRFGERWGNKTKVEHKGSVGHTLNVNVRNRPQAFSVKDMSPEQLRSMEAILLDMKGKQEDSRALPSPDIVDTELEG